MNEVRRFDEEARMTFAEALCKAQRSGQPFDTKGMALPGSIAEATGVQAEVAGMLGSVIAGWKVGMTPDRTTPVAAPLYADRIVPAAGVHRPGANPFLAVEVEIGFRLISDASNGLEGALGEAFVGIEIVGSRMKEGPKAPFPAFLADNIGNEAYVVGPGLSGWESVDLARLRCTLSLDGETVHSAVGGHPQGDPLFPLRAYLAEPSDRLGGLRAGQIVTTGTLSGVVPIGRPCTVRAALEGFGEISVRVEV